MKVSKTEKTKSCGKQIKSQTRYDITQLTESEFALLTLGLKSIEQKGSKVSKMLDVLEEISDDFSY